MIATKKEAATTKNSKPSNNDRPVDGHGLVKYNVTLTLTEDMLGSSPKNREVYATYVASKASPEQLAEEVQLIENVEERGWTGFRGDDGGIMLLDYQIKGFLKEQADALRECGALQARNAKDDGPLGGVKGKIDRHLFVFPRRLRILDEDTGKPLLKPDGINERPMRAMTAQGPRVSLVRSDMVRSGRVMKCSIATTWPALFKEELIQQMLERGEVVGLGQWRNASHGRFTFTLDRA